jgi:hypothetical protein
VKAFLFFILAAMFIIVPLAPASAGDVTQFSPQTPAGGAPAPATYWRDTAWIAETGLPPNVNIGVSATQVYDYSMTGNGLAIRTEGEFNAGSSVSVSGTQSTHHDYSKPSTFEAGSNSETTNVDVGATLGDDSTLSITTK